MALQNFRWENGTSQHPVELNQSQLNNLLKLALNEQIISDVRGHIATSSGLIAKYTKWQLEQKYEHLVIHAEETADTLSLVPVRSAINEGEQTTITVTGMTASSVKFRLQHSFRNVYGISQSAAQARIHMDGNVLVVDDPEENASWIDDVTVQAIPIYEEWSNPETIASCTVTVTAKELTGIVLTTPAVCVLGETFAADVTLIPSTNTKKNHVALDASCISDGALAVRKPTVQGLAVYTAAPAEDCSLTLTVNAYLFGDTDAVAFTDTVSGIHSMNPYIQFTITTDGTFSDISAANPKIHLQKLDSEDAPVELTGTVSGDSLVFVYGGGNVKGNGRDAFQVTFDEAPQGYRNIQQMTITPNQVVTEITVQYVVNRPDIYQVYTDGTYEPISVVQERGYFLNGKTPVGIGIVTDDFSFMFAVDGSTFAGGTTYNLISNDITLPSSIGLFASDVDYTIRANTLSGKHNTDIILDYLRDNNLWDDSFGICYVYNKTITYGGITYHGYVGSIPELLVFDGNKTLLNSYISALYGVSDYCERSRKALRSSDAKTDLAMFYNISLWTTDTVDSNNKGTFTCIGAFYEFNIN